ncbi:MAG: VOC family protein [Verrucomicrobiota bacterium]
MSTPVKPIPDGFHAVTPYIAVQGAARAIEFYKQAFGAVERYRLPSPDGQGIGHAEIQLGNSIVMLSDEFPEYGKVSPLTVKGTSVTLALYVEDVDAVFNRAVAAGAKVMQPVADKFYGDRSGCLVDPFGHEWTVMTHKEDVSPEEMTKRLQKFYEEMASGK